MIRTIRLMRTGSSRRAGALSLPLLQGEASRGEASPVRFGAIGRVCRSEGFQGGSGEESGRWSGAPSGCAISREGSRDSGPPGRWCPEEAPLAPRRSSSRAQKHSSGAQKERFWRPEEFFWGQKSLFWAPIGRKGTFARPWVAYTGQTVL